MGTGTLAPWVLLCHSFCPHTVLFLAGAGTALSLQVKWNSALQGTCLSLVHSLCSARAEFSEACQNQYCALGEYREQVSTCLVEAGRCKTQEILASATAGSSTELGIDWHGLLVFVMVGFPPHAHLDNLAVPSFFGPCIKHYNMRGKSKHNQNYLYETHSIKQLLAISTDFL